MTIGRAHEDEFIAAFAPGVTTQQKIFGWTFFSSFFFRVTLRFRRAITTATCSLGCGCFASKPEAFDDFCTYLDITCGDRYLGAASWASSEPT